jgi:hypothetical protein
VRFVGIAPLLLVLGLVGLGASAPSAAAPPTSAPSLCTNPVWTSSPSQQSWNTNEPAQFWWVNNDAWAGTHGPQTISECNHSSWYATSNQPNNGGQVETYPDTEYDVGGRDHRSTTPLSGWGSITSTFAEQNPAAGGWDAAYDLWTNNWGHETMIWNQWAGSQSYWPAQANGSGGFALTLDGVPYHFFANGAELMFFRDTQVTSGSVDLLAAWEWEVAHGFAKATDIPTQIEYGTEVAYTSGTEKFNTTDFGVSLTPTTTACTAVANANKGTNGSCYFPDPNPEFTGRSGGTPEVDTNMWNPVPNARVKVTASNPSVWSASANIPSGHGGSVVAYTNSWAKDYTGRVDAFSHITQTFAESMPHNAQTTAHAMDDLWFDNRGYEVMVQYDFSNDAPCVGARPEVRTNVPFGGQLWHLCQNGHTLVWKLGGGDATEQSESAGTIHIKAMVKWLEENAYLPAKSTWTALSSGWEFSSTGGVPETFAMTGFTVSA